MYREREIDIHTHYLSISLCIYIYIYILIYTLTREAHHICWNQHNAHQHRQSMHLRYDDIICNPTQSTSSQRI